MKIFLLALCSSLILLVSCDNEQRSALGRAKDLGKKPIKVRGYIVAKLPLVETVLANGAILAQEETELRPEIAGRLTDIYFKEGTSINRGTIIAKLYDDDLQARRRKLQIQLQAAKLEETRQKELLSIAGTTAREAEAAELQVKNLQADIELLDADIAKTTIKAPFSGEIGLRDISPGAFVSTNTVIAILRQTAALKLDFSVPEQYGSAVKKGKIVLFTSAGSNDTLEARITATEPGVNKESRTLRVRAAILSPQGLTPGSFAKTIISIERPEPALMIPAHAIRSQSREQKVALLRGNTAIMTPVKTGLRTNSMVEVIDGIREGDTIAVSGMMFLNNGSTVTMSSAETAKKEGAL